MDEKQQVLLDVLLLEASLDKLLNDLSLLLLRSALDLDLLEALQGALLDHELLSLLNIQSKRLSFCTLECIFVPAKRRKYYVSRFYNLRSSLFKAIEKS